MYIEKYFEFVIDNLKIIYETQTENIKKTADIIIDCILNKGSVYVFGATHAGILSEELFYRAGGLMLINPIFPPDLIVTAKPITITTKVENLEGYGKIIIENSKITDKDVIIIHSVSGRNIVPIEAAMTCKEIGAKLIVITNLSFSKSIKSRHPSGKKLHEIDPDVIIDNCGIIGDACVEIKGMKQKVGPTSTVSGCLIVNAVIVNVVEKLVEKGIEPPVFMSANLDGSAEFNGGLVKKYLDQIKYI